MEFHASKPWPEITKALRGAKKRRIAVTPYLQTGAVATVPLRRGDMLIVDASDLNVKSGSTNPNEIETFRKKGVKCYTVSDLHAKVYVADNQAFVGSANATANSKNTLHEACLEVRSSIICESIEAWIESLAIVPLTESELKRLIGIYKPAKWPKKSIASKPLRLARTWISWIADYDEYVQSAAFEKHVEKAKQQFEDKDSDITWIALRSSNPPKCYRDAQPGDEIYVIDRGQSPARVYHRRIVSATIRVMDAGKPVHRILMEEPVDEPSLSYSQFLKIAKKVGIALPYTGKSHKGVSALVAGALRKACRVAM